MRIEEIEPGFWADFEAWLAEASGDTIKPRGPTGTKKTKKTRENLIGPEGPQAPVGLDEDAVTSAKMQLAQAKKSAGRSAYADKVQTINSSGASPDEKAQKLSKAAEQMNNIDKSTQKTMSTAQTQLTKGLNGK